MGRCELVYCLVSGHISCGIGQRLINRLCILPCHGIIRAEAHSQASGPCKSAGEQGRLTSLTLVHIYQGPSRKTQIFLWKRLIGWISSDGMLFHIASWIPGFRIMKSSAETNSPISRNLYKWIRCRSPLAVSCCWNRDSFLKRDDQYGVCGTITSQNPCSDIWHPAQLRDCCCKKNVIR